MNQPPDNTPGSNLPGPSLKARALRLLATREHSRAELERKLQPHETEPGELSAALDALQTKGFIDEARVADSVLHRRAHKLGGRRVLQELQHKGLPDHVIDEAAATLHATEAERARAVWQKKFGTPATNAQERAKHMRFLASRGFSGDVIRKTLSDLGSDDED
jgi:regulatory protein